MSLCPLLQKECIREQCAWWHGGFERSQTEAACAVKNIARFTGLIHSQIAGFIEYQVNLED